VGLDLEGEEVGNKVPEVQEVQEVQEGQPEVLVVLEVLEGQALMQIVPGMALVAAIIILTGKEGESLRMIRTERIKRSLESQRKRKSGSLQ